MALGRPADTTLRAACFTNALWSSKRDQLAGVHRFPQFGSDWIPRRQNPWIGRQTSDVSLYSEYKHSWQRRRAEFRCGLHRQPVGVSVDVGARLKEQGKQLKHDLVQSESYNCQEAMALLDRLRNHFGETTNDHTTTAGDHKSYSFILEIRRQTMQSVRPLLIEAAKHLLYIFASLVKASSPETFYNLFRSAPEYELQLLKCHDLTPNSDLDKSDSNCVSRAERLLEALSWYDALRIWSRCWNYQAGRNKILAGRIV